MLNAQGRYEQRRQQHGGQIRDNQPSAFGCGRANQFSDLGVFEVEMHEEGWQEPQPNTDDRPDKNGESWRRNVVKEFGIELQQRASKEEDQPEAEEEEYPLKVALAAMAEDDDDPEERKERSRGENDEA
jgi:hypothetical protein